MSFKKIYYLFEILFYLVLILLLPWIISFFTGGDHVDGICHCDDNPTTKEYLITLAIVVPLLFYKNKNLIIKSIQRLK